MEGYEQLEFEETRNLWNIKTLIDEERKCFDSAGNEINIGDYVVAVSGESKIKCNEGIVVNIFFDAVVCNITISTYGGKIIERYGNPLMYKKITI